MNIKNRCIFKNVASPVLLRYLVILVSVFYFESVQAAQYKCIDENDNVTYSDQRCLNQTRQKLDIIVAPVDKAAAERLKYYKDYESPTRNVKNKIIILEDGKGSKKCDYLSRRLKSLRKKSRAGYDSAAGESIRKKTRQASKAYHDCMNK